MSYEILIRRNSDGETRRYVFDWASWDEETDPYWLTDGNYGCDCNRHTAFERAGGNNGFVQEPCGEGAYSILKAILPDGTEIPVDAEDS